MKEIIVVFIIVILVCLFYYIYSFNKVISLSNKVKEGYSSIDVALKKRYDLINNLLEVVKGYTAYESKVLVEIAQSRSLTSKNELLDREKNSLMAIVEAYPQIKANEQYKQLMLAMIDCEEHLQAARRFYNSNVNAYNTCIQQFPCNIVANNMKYVPQEFFKCDEIEKNL